MPEYFPSRNVESTGGKTVDLGTTNNLDVSIGSSSSEIAVFGTTGSLRVAGYTTFGNLSTLRTLDADVTNLGQVADCLGTLIEDLKAYGWFVA